MNKYKTNTVRYHYIYTLSSGKTESEGNKYVVYHRGERMLIEHRQVEWAEEEPLTPEEYVNRTNDTN